MGSQTFCAKTREAGGLLLDYNQYDLSKALRLLTQWIPSCSFSGGNRPKGCLTPIGSIPHKPVVSWERDTWKLEMIGLPLLGLNGDHTAADAALVCSSDGRRESGGRSYRWPSHSARSADRGSSTSLGRGVEMHGVPPLQLVLRPTEVILVGLWATSRIMAATQPLSGYGSLGSMGVMTPSLSSIAAAASRHRSSR